MPILGGLLVSLFSGLASFFATWLGLRAAAVAAALATFATLNAALYAAALAAVAGIGATFPSIVMTGVWLMVPDNAVLCFSAIATCDTFCALYRFNNGALRLAATAG